MTFTCVSIVRDHNVMISITVCHVIISIAVCPEAVVKI